MDDQKEKIEARMVQCSICQGPHFTAKCQHKAKFADTIHNDEKNRDHNSVKGSSDKKPSSDQPDSTVRLTNLPFGTSENDVVNLCNKFGEVARAYVAKDFKTGAIKGWAFVNFISPDSAKKAISVLNGYRYGNMILKAHLAN